MSEKQDMQTMPVTGLAAMELAGVLRASMTLDRPAVRSLIKSLLEMLSAGAQCEVVQEQLEAMLERKDWAVISVTMNAATVRTSGVSIGVVEWKPGKAPKPQKNPWKR